MAHEAEVSREMAQRLEETGEAIRVPDPPGQFDRCDKCQSQAFGIITVLHYDDETFKVTDKGDVFLCGHHLAEFRPVAEDNMWPIYDYTERIPK